MKKVMLFIAVVLTLSASASEPKPALSKTEKKIEKALSKIDMSYKKDKNFEVAFSSYKETVKKFGEEAVQKVMGLLKTCNETCIANLNTCKRNCCISVGIPSGEQCYWDQNCIQMCEQIWFMCWLGCGGIWGS